MHTPQNNDAIKGKEIPGSRIVDIITHSALAIIMSYVLAHVLVWIWLGCPVGGI